MLRPKLVGKDAKMPDLLILIGTLGGSFSLVHRVHHRAARLRAVPDGLGYLWHDLQRRFAAGGRTSPPAEPKKQTQICRPGKKAKEKSLESLEPIGASLSGQDALQNHMSKIDFIGIGAPKCGTTWLSAQLEAHPQIGFAPDKEVYYFADTIMRRLAGSELNCFRRGETWYHEQFPAAVAPIR